MKLHIHQDHAWLFLAESCRGPITIVRTDAQVRKVLAQLDTGEQVEVPSVGSDPAVGLTFYATLLQRSVSPTSITALDSAGRVIAESPLRGAAR